MCLGDIRLPVYFYLQVGSILTRFSHVSFFRCESSLKVPTLYKWPCRYTFIQVCHTSTRYLIVYVIIVIRLSISDRHFFRWFTFFELLLCLKINSEFAKNEYVRITVTCGNGYFSVYSPVNFVTYINRVKLVWKISVWIVLTQKIQKCVKRLFIPYTELSSDFFMFTRYSRDRKTHASIKIILKKMKKIKAIYGIMRCKQNYSLTLLKPFINFSVFGIITATAYITTRNYTKTMTSRHNFQFYVKC